MKAKIVSSVSNDIVADQRLHKVCSSLAADGFSVLLIGTTWGGKPKLDFSFGTELLSIWCKKGVFFYLELQIRLFWKLFWMPKRDVILLANDLDTLIPNYLIAKLFRLKLIYDSHEIFTEMPSLKDRKRRKQIWKFFESKILPKIQYFYTVSNSYQKWFYQEYAVKSLVIKNVPKLQYSIPNSEPKISLPQNPNHDPIILYQGAINRSRGLENMIEAMQFLENYQFWIIGTGPILLKLQALAKELNVLNQSVFFLGRIEPDILKTITPRVDLGISLEQDDGLSYRYALPNKIFDYIHAGVPILASNLDEISSLVQDYGIGEIIESHNPKHLIEKIQDIIKNTKSKYQNNLQKASQDLHWGLEEKKLLALYNSIV